MPSDSESRLRELVIQKIPDQVTHVVNANAIIKAIGSAHEHLTRTQFQHVFGSLQNFLVAPLILTTCNLFEKPSKKHPNFSIPTAQRYLRAACEEPTFLAKNALAIELLIQKQVNPSYTLAAPHQASEAAEMVCAHFERACPQYNNPRTGHPLDDALRKLREQRDKRVAHLEDNLVGPSTDVGGLLQLLEFTSTFVNSIGNGFLGISNLILPPKPASRKSKAGDQMKKLIDMITPVGDVKHRC